MGVGDRIRARREFLGMTQDELAARMGYKSRSTIAKIEKGVNDVTQTTLVKLAEALTTTPSYLMGWVPEAETKKPTENGELSNKKRAILERVKQMSDEELDRVDQILRLVENTK